MKVIAVRLVVENDDGTEVVVDMPRVRGEVEIKQDGFADSSFGPQATVHGAKYPYKRLEIASDDLKILPDETGREYTVVHLTGVRGMRLRPTHTHL